MDLPRSGRPPKLTKNKRKILLQAIRNRTTRKSNRQSLAELAKGRKISRMTLWRLLRSVQRRDSKK
jgi:transposase